MLIEKICIIKKLKDNYIVVVLDRINLAFFSIMNPTVDSSLI